MAPQIILYAYPESPFGQKLIQVLVLKQLPYAHVLVPRMPPRSALADSLGVTYRRIPVLAIGNDVFLDTSLAVLALERIFPANPLSTASWGLQTASSFFWADRAVFRVAASLLPWDKMPDAFVKDRSSYMGNKIDTQAIIKNRPNAESAMRSHLAVIEAQLSKLSSPSNFILNTSSPTYLDLTLSFTLNWVASFRTAPHLFDSFPLVAAWLARLSSAVKAATASHPTKGVPNKMSAEDAAKIVHGSKPDQGECVADAGEPLLREKWLSLGAMVDVTPDDNGKVPQKGRLVGLNAEQAVLEVVGAGGKTCRVHAPRMGFTVRASK
ncbi:hypothetical protein RQP46_009512 [Phenoliferia psychrophenolica]